MRLLLVHVAFNLILSFVLLSVIPLISTLVVFVIVKVVLLLLVKRASPVPVRGAKVKVIGAVLLVGRISTLTAAVKSFPTVLSGAIETLGFAIISASGVTRLLLFEQVPHSGSKSSALFVSFASVFVNSSVSVFGDLSSLHSVKYGPGGHSPLLKLKLTQKFVPISTSPAP